MMSRDSPYVYFAHPAIIDAPCLWLNRLNPVSMQTIEIDINIKQRAEAISIWVDFNHFI